MSCLKSKAEFGTFWRKFAFWGVKIESYIHISMALIVELAVMDCFQSCCYPLYLNSIPLFHQKITAKHHNYLQSTQKTLLILSYNIYLQKCKTFLVWNYKLLQGTTT